MYAINNQSIFFSRNIASVTPKIIYFYYQKKSFLDQSIRKKVYLISKTEALSILPCTRHLYEMYLNPSHVFTRAVLMKQDQACAYTPTRAQTATRGLPRGSVDKDSASYLPIALRPNPIAPCSWRAGELAVRISHWQCCRFSRNIA